MCCGAPASGAGDFPAFDVGGLLFGARRDTGLAMQGPLNPSGTLSYRAMYGAPVDFGSDSNDRERWMGALACVPRRILSCA